MLKAEARSDRAPTRSKGCVLSRVLKSLSIVLVAFVIAGCGAGEDGAGAPHPTTPDAPISANAPTAANAATNGGSPDSEGTMAVAAARATQKASGGGREVRTCDGGSILLNAAENRLVGLHNESRTQRGLEPLCVNPTLTEAARAHSRDMIEGDYFAHATPGGATLGDRLKRFGYTPEGYRFWKVGGNIAWHSGAEPQPENMFEGWMNSPPHRHNILEEDFRQIGVGTAAGEYKNHEDSVMYTAQFGVRRG